MKILLVSPTNSDLLHAVSVPVGLISIATYLKNAGHEVKIVDLSVSHVTAKVQTVLIFAEIIAYKVNVFYCKIMHPAKTSVKGDRV